MHRGKRRAILESPSEGSTSSLTLLMATPAKKPKRAETRQCPVCSEHIPLRLLPVHSELEMERVEHIMRNVGSTEILAGGLEEGSSPRDRRSAARARRSISALNQRVGREDTLALSSKTIQVIRRHRKQRHTKLRELTRDEEDENNGSERREVSVCPVCLQTVGGDQDVVEAHIDACLAHQSLTAAQEENSLEDGWDDIEIGEEMTFIGSTTSLRAMGFHVRNRNEDDVDDEVDVDGDDEAMFGDVQFTEGDILSPNSDSRHIEGGQEPGFIPNSDGDDTQVGHESLRDLVANGKIPRRRTEAKEGVVNGDRGGADHVIALARKSGNPSLLISALESKIRQLTQELTSTSNSTSPLCRICIDPYTEPTISTGCWHTCCKECWLRCLGSTKLCPICKRITAATELRRIYL